MNTFDLAIYVLKFFIPSAFSMLFRGVALGYKSRSKFALGLLVFTLYLLIVPGTLISIMGYGQYTHIAAVVMTISGFSALIYSTDPPDKTIFLVLLQGNMVATISIPLNMIRHLLGLPYSALVVMLLVVCPIVYMIALRFWAKPLRFIADNIHGNMLGHLSIPILTMAIINILPIFPKENFVNYPIFCTALMMTVELVFFLYMCILYSSLKQITLLSEQNQNQNLMKLQVNSMEQRMHMMDESARQMGILNHDRRHFNNMLLQLLYQGETNHAIEKLEKQSSVRPFTNTKRYCENATVNAIVSYYATLYEQESIIFEINLDIPLKINMENIELSMVMSNLMENALNACKKANNKKDRFVRISAHFTGNLLLEMENSCEGEICFDENGYPITKEEKHGIGTKSVLAVVEKQKGLIEYLCENKIFRVRIMI